MTFADYDALPETNQIVELIDGEIFVNPPLDKHQQVMWEIVAILTPLMRGGTPRFAPCGLHFDDGNSFEPDLFWVSRDNPHCFLEDNGYYWHGAPDLVIEVLSPSTAFNDRGKKFDTYQQHGVREYWLVEPEASFIEVYRLEGEHFARHGLFKAGESFVSQVLGNAEISTQSWFVTDSPAKS